MTEDFLGLLGVFFYDNTDITICINPLLDDLGGNYIVFLFIPSLGVDDELGL